MLYDPTGLLSFLPRQLREITWKQAVHAVATANVNLSSLPTTIDGVSMAVGYRFLAPVQTDGTQNGIYRWTGASGTAVRDFDMDQDPNTEVSAEEVFGAVVWCPHGTVNAGTLWYTLNDPGWQMGVDDMDWAQVSVGSALSVEEDGDTPVTDVESIIFESGTNVDVTVTEDAAGIARVLIDATGGGGGGGGVAFSYVGKESIGASMEGPIDRRSAYAKEFTATADGLLTHVEAYVQGNASNIGAIAVTIHEDDAGEPGTMIGQAHMPTQMVYLLSTGRWLTFPASLRITAVEVARW